MSVRSLLSPQNKLFARLSLAHFFVDGYTGFMLPLLPVLATALHFNKAEAGLLLSISSFGSALMQPIYGHWTDKFRKVNFMIVGLLLASVFISLIGFAPNYWTLAGLILLGYFGAGLYHPTATTCVNRLKTEYKNVMMGTFMSAGVVGFAFGMFASSFLVEQGGLQATLWAACGGLLGMILCYGARKQIGLGDEEHLTDPRWKEPLTRWETRLLVLLCVIGILRGFVLVGVQAFLPFVWTEQGHSLMLIGTVVSISSLIGGPTGVLGGWIADRIGEKRLLFYSFLPCFALLPGMLSTDGWLSFGLFIALCGCLEATIGTTLVIAFREVRKKPNTISGIVNGLAWGLSGMLMPLFGAMGDAMGMVPALYVAMFPALLVGTALIFLLPKKSPLSPAATVTPLESVASAEAAALPNRARMGG